ncbi:DNA gyrase subunit A [Chromobacterium violaceum]|uniref:DNA gyrase subunit A n=1 Tax=Chromobacterium violaceum TaxID=536 RepID=A0A3S4IGA0_CHRVL|nr:DNA gyrase subunit A [Chromobacterium violaceum]
MTISHTGYIKAQPIDDYSSQRRGGRGKQAAATKDDDFIETLFVANTHDYVLCFSSRGRCYWRKVYDLPQGGRQSRASRWSTCCRWKRARRSTRCCGQGVPRRPVRVHVHRQRTVKKTPLVDFSVRAPPASSR